MIRTDIKTTLLIVVFGAALSAMAADQANAGPLRNGCCASAITESTV